MWPHILGGQNISIKSISKDKTWNSNLGTSIAWHILKRKWRYVALNIAAKTGKYLQNMFYFRILIHTVTCVLVLEIYHTISKWECIYPLELFSMKYFDA